MIRRDFLKCAAMSALPTGLLVVGSPLKAGMTWFCGNHPLALPGSWFLKFAPVQEVYHDMPVIRYVLRSPVPDITFFTDCRDPIGSLNKQPLRWFGHESMVGDVFFHSATCWLQMAHDQQSCQWKADLHFLESDRGWESCGRTWDHFAVKDWETLLRNA